MDIQPIKLLLTRASDVYACGDYISGDMMMTSILSMLSKLFGCDSERAKLFSMLAEIRIAREAQDFTALSDKFRYEILPYLESLNSKTISS